MQAVVHANGQPSGPQAPLQHKAKAAGRQGCDLLMTFRHLEPTEAIRAYAEKRFSRLTRSLGRGITAHLILSVDKYRKCGEVTVKSGRFAFAAETQSKDLYAVIDGLADLAARQLKKRIAKVKARKTRAPSVGEALLESEPAAGPAQS